MAIQDSPGYESARWRIKISHFTEQGYDIKGVIHVGANDGEELFWYWRMGIHNLIAFEPLSKVCAKLQQDYPQATCFNYALGNEDRTATLNVGSGSGKASSLMKPNLDHPEVVDKWSVEHTTFVGTEDVELLKFSTWVERHPEIKLDDYDCLVLDTQGNELDILKGMGEYLLNFKYLCVELSQIPIYDGETSGAEVAAWLKVAGWTQDSPIVSHDDVFFIRHYIKPESDMIYRGKA